jgi:hypothetical protein
MYTPNIKLLKRLNMTGIRGRIAHPLAAMGVIYAAYAIIFAPVAHATPLQYSIIFTTHYGIAPSAGSFFYDASAIGSQFSSFIVTWDGIQYDLTAAANSPVFEAGALGECSSSVFLFLSTGSACTTHAPGAPSWDASAYSGFFEFLDEDPDFDGILQVIDYSATPMSFLNGAGGFAIEIAATGVPEPTTLLLVLAGGGWLLYLRRSFPATKRNRPAGPNPHPLP